MILICACITACNSSGTHLAIQLPDKISFNFDALAYKRIANQTKKLPKKGLIFAISGEILMAFFYRFVASSMASNFEDPETGLMTPCTLPMETVQTAN